MNAEGKGDAVKQTHGSRTQPINGSQNERIKVKLNERNANSCLLPQHHHSNSHCCVQSKSPYEADLQRELFKASFLQNQSAGLKMHNKPTLKKFVLADPPPRLTCLLKRLLI